MHPRCNLRWGYEVAGAFVVLAAVAITGSAWVLVIAFAAHGLKDLWQERRQFARNTHWWPPFCAVDFLVAAILVVAIAADADFRG